MTSVAAAAHQVKLAAIDLTHVETYADLIAAVGDRRLVLLGEASHGTHTSVNFSCRRLHVWTVVLVPESSALT